MTDKNIQIKDLDGNLLFPKTKAAIVINNSNENLGTVEAGAQVNKIEKIKLNGTELSIVNKEVNVAITHPEYSIAKATTADEGYAATYQLTKDGVAIGTKINITKDKYIGTPELKTCTTANSPITGLAVGDKYLEFPITNSNEKQYLSVADLYNVYVAGTGIEFNGKTIKIDETVVAKKSDLSSYVTTTGTAAKATADASGNVITSTYATKTELSSLTTTVNGKAAKATTLAGYGITDAVSTTTFNNANLLTYEELA